LIQREPGNALARFLFSSMLANESAADGDELHDPVLPTGVTHDVSMCRELQKVNVSTDEAHRICEALCLAVREAVTRLDDVRERETSRSAQSDVVLAAYGAKYIVRWEEESEVVSVPHLQDLQRMYATHSSNDAASQHFNRRLFCLLNATRPWAGRRISVV
jgi:hypothetical protein